MTTPRYSEAITALMTAVRTLTAYFPNSYQVSFNHADVNRGGEYWFFCTPGAFTKTRHDNGDKLTAWQTNAELWVRYTTEAESAAKLIAARDAIDALLDTPGLLRSANVLKTVATGGNLQQDIAGKQPNFIIQPLLLTIEQRVINRPV